MEYVEYKLNKKREERGERAKERKIERRKLTSTIQYLYYTRVTNRQIGISFAHVSSISPSVQCDMDLEVLKFYQRVIITPYSDLFNSNCLENVLCLLFLRKHKMEKLTFCGEKKEKKKES